MINGDTVQCVYESSKTTAPMGRAQATSKYFMLVTSITGIASSVPFIRLFEWRKAIVACAHSTFPFSMREYLFFAKDAVGGP